jgi:uncharacterized cupredoxin-like copper-binding protein
MLARATLLAATTTLAAAVALTACGEDRQAGGGTARTTPTPVAAPPATPGRAVASADVSLVDYRLDPSDLRVGRSGVISFVATNDGQSRHALAVDGPAGEVRSVALRPGERTTISLRLPRGTYKWYCPIADHERRGMVGQVRVGE